MMHNTRHTFGTIDPSTGSRYSDIVKSDIIRDYLSFRVVDSNNIKSYYYKGKMYYLNLDKKLKDYLRANRVALVVISIQEREDINIAVARLYEDTINGS